MTITTAICNSYKQEILEGVHASTDTYKIALYTDAATLGAATTAYSATNEVTGTGYTAGGVTPRGFTVINGGARVFTLESAAQISEAAAVGQLGIDEESLLMLLVA